MYKLDPHGVEFLAGWESFVPYVYDDKAALVKVGKRRVPREWKPGMPVLGTLTCGYGHTDEAAHPLKMRDLYETGRKLTKDEGLEILDIDLDECEAAVNKLVKVPLTQGQFNALTSLTFNMGTTNVRNSSLLAKLNRKDYVGARAAFDLYIRSKGEVMEGLQNRRDSEQRLWDEVVPSKINVPDDGYDFPVTPKQIDPTQPTKSMMESTMANAQVGIGVVAGVGTAAKAVSGLGPEPAPTQKVTEVVDGAGRMITSVSELVRDVPEPSVWHKVALVLCDPIVIILFGSVTLALCAYTWFERRRHAREGNF